MVVRGEIVDVDLDGASGREKMNGVGGTRPCVVVQNNKGNEHSPLTVVAPLTDLGQFKNLPVQVLVTVAELGFPGAKESVVECGHVRTIDLQRVKSSRGHLDPRALLKVDTALRVSLGLR